eukprot:GHVL01008345.1.p1 GENE.GHVL01008345.1~~GHVL01008345.1.p1  ORF type:complete len:236 (-),score=34.31 GHVL01008345.1:81-788(-)
MARQINNLTIVLLLSSSLCQNPEDAVSIETIRQPVLELCTEKYNEKRLERMSCILRVTNYLRCFHGVQMLKWNEEAAMNAQAHADKCSTDSHSESYELPLQSAENMASGKSLVDIPETLPELFWVEYSNWLEQNGKVWGHFSAMVWDTTSVMGCGTCIDDDNSIYVCHYALEASNMGNEPEKHVFNIKAGVTVQECIDMSADKTENNSDNGSSYAHKTNVFALLAAVISCISSML